LRQVKKCNPQWGGALKMASNNTLCHAKTSFWIVLDHKGNKRNSPKAYAKIDEAHQKIWEIYLYFYKKHEGMNLAITFFPIYGLTLGINYIDNELQDVERTDGMREHVIQILLFFFGFNIIWYSYEAES
jgi:hypothetical protein